MKKKKLLIILGIIVITFMVIGVSYAYYIKTFSQVNSNVVKTKCLNLSLTNEKNDIKLDEQYPIPDSEGKKLVPYQFTITNICEQFISYNVNLEALEGTTMDSNAIKVMVNNEAPVNLATLNTAQTSINNSVESRTLVTGSLGSGDSVDYAIRLWMDYGDSADLSSMNKVFNSKVVVTATLGTYKPSNYVTTLHDAILINEYGVTDVDNAIKKIESKGTPDLSQTAPIVLWQEQKMESAELKISKPDISVINDKSNTQVSNLTESDTKIRLYRHKSFNEKTARYTLSDYIVVDPTTLDYSSNNTYYIAEESIRYNTETGKLYSNITAVSSNVYEVVGAQKYSSTSTWNNENYSSITYKLQTNILDEIELESDKSDKGLYSSTDDYGKTYYYRGNVANNNVIFAGYQWQIVRINGDGSIRLLYNGIKGDNSDTKKSINNKFYKFNDVDGNPTYVGYKFGNVNSKLYDEVHANNYSSSIKSILDVWYIDNIENMGYDKYISTESAFCGDRTLYGGSGGDGINLGKDTRFGAYQRFRNSNVIFYCPNKERDLYTMSSAKIGNKSLDYPIGLITSDEIIFSGINGVGKNKYAWSYSSEDYWTMSPAYSSGAGRQLLWSLNLSGMVVHSWNTYELATRPVINLKADVKISGGIGTINDPYIIKTE